MKPHANIVLSSIVYCLIPTAQRGLSAIRRVITMAIDRLDRLAFRLAEKTAGDD